MSAEQPKAAGREGGAVPQPHAPLFDPYADSRMTSYEKEQALSPGDKPLLSFSVPESRTIDDLSLAGRGRPNDDLYDGWLAANASMDRIADRVAAADRDFVSPLSYDFFGMDCEFIRCKIPHTGCVVSPFIVGCSF